MMDRAKRRGILLSVVLGSGVVFLDTTVVNLALKKIGEELPRSLFGVLEAQSYIYAGYLVTLSSLLILAGALSDYYGRRKLFIIGLAGFGATSLLCGIAPNTELLILFRILQGAAGAVLVPGSLAIITSEFEGEEQGRAFGIWAGASAATTILGPLLGGILVNTVSWRLAFLINVPVVALALYACLRHVPESRDEDSTGVFDWLGAAIVVVAIGGLSFGAIRGQERQWQETLPFISLTLGAIALIALPFWLRRSRDPLVPLKLFKSRNFNVTNLATLLIYGALYVSGYYFAVYVVGILGYTEPAAGLASLPATLFLVFFSTYFGKLADRYGPRIFMTLGPALMGLGLLWLTRIPQDSAAWRLDVAVGASWIPPSDYAIDLLPAWGMFGIGLMMMVAPLTTALMRSVSPANSGVASAVNNAISRVGAPLAGALIFVAITATFYASLGAKVPSLDTSSQEVRLAIAPLNPPAEEVFGAARQGALEASTESFRIAMAVAAIFLFVGAAINGIGIINPAKKKPEQAPPKEADAPPLP